MIDKSSIFRAFTEFPCLDAAVFVEAGSHKEAMSKIFDLLCLLYRVSRDEIIVYDMASWHDLIVNKVSPDPDMRLFENGWNDDRPTYITNPLFLAPENNRFLLAKWTELQFEQSRIASEAVVGKIIKPQEQS